MRLSGNKTLDELSIQSKLVAGENITIDGTTISATGGLNIGDTFYTTRTDNELNGAVEANGAQYNFADVNGGDNNIQLLIANGSLPYLPIAEFDAMVAEQGGCDSFGYGTNELIIYPVTFVYGSGSEILCYTNITNWVEVETDSDNKLLNVKLYDKDTHEELVGYYVKYMPETDYYYVYNNSDENMYGFEAVYPDGDGEPITLPTGGEFQPTTYFKVPKKVGRVLVRSQKPTADNDSTWFNVYSDGWCEQGGTVNGGTSQTATFPVEMADTKYTIAYGNRSGTYEQVRTATRETTSITIKNANNAGTVSTDWQVSGYANSSEYTPDKWDYQNIQVLRPMVQLFNSATDEAVATCTEVLADVANLKLATNGIIDYVVESQEPTEANGYTWYRLYKSGWVEQGGRQETTIPSGTSTVRQGISLPIEMSDTKYNTQLTQEQIVASITLSVAKRRGEATADPSTSTTLFIIARNIISVGVADKVNYMWQVSGMSAQGSN